jgi:hypothetical protein
MGHDSRISSFPGHAPFDRRDWKSCQAPTLAPDQATLNEWRWQLYQLKI